MSPNASIVPSGGECKVFKARVSSVDSSSNGPDVMQGEKSKRWETVRKIVQERKRNRDEASLQSNFVENDPTPSSTANVYFPGDSSPDVENEVVEEVIFRSTDIRYRNTTAKQKMKTEISKKKDGKVTSDLLDGRAGRVENKKDPSEIIPTVLPKIPALSINSGHHSWMIPTVICTPQRLFQRSADVDIIIQRIRHHLWKTPTNPPEIVTPSTAHFYNQEGDDFAEAIETLLMEPTIGVSYEGHKASEMKYLVISTPSDVHVFDVEAFGRNLFRWGLYSVLGNDDCVKIVHDSRQLCDILY